MNHSDIAALMKGAAPVIRDLVVSLVEPLVTRIDQLEQQLRERDDAEMVRALVADAVAAIPPAPAGKDGAPGRDGADGAPGKDGADGKEGPAGRDGKDGIDGKDGAPGERGADGAPGRDGEPGKDGRDGADGINGKDGQPGREGPPGKLAPVKAYAPGVHYEADVVTHKGGTYQVLKDTADEPGSDDWICLAAPGRDGADGRRVKIRGTFAADAEYSELDLVALNGGSFIAKKDNPGPCPGEGWQLVASQGKTGKPGERGIPGRGERGEPGLPVVAASISDVGLLTLVNGDGSTVDCDLYPLLSKLG